MRQEWVIQGRGDIRLPKGSWASLFKDLELVRNFQQPEKTLRDAATGLRQLKSPIYPNAFTKTP